MLISSLLIVAALPDSNSLLALTELITYCPESFSENTMRRLLPPLFDLLCLQLRVPDSISDETYLMFLGVHSTHRGTVNLSQDEEDGLCAVLELRCEPLPAWMIVCLRRPTVHTAGCRNSR